MRRGLPILIGALVLLVTACGGAASGTASDSGSATATDRLGEVQERDQLIVGVRYNVPPFDWLNPETGEVEGFDIDVAKELAERILGSPDKIEFVQAESDSRIPMLQQGDVDLVLATMTITDERKEEIDFSQPYFPSGIGLMVAKDSDIDDFEDVRGMTLCAGQGSAAYELTQAALMENYGFDDIEVEYYPDTAQCAEALASGRVDFVATDQGILIGIEQSRDDVKVIPGLIITNDPWGIGVAKGNPQLLAAVDEALDEMFADGTWEELYRQWTKGEPPDGWPPQE